MNLDGFTEIQYQFYTTEQFLAFRLTKNWYCSSYVPIGISFSRDQVLGVQHLTN